MPVPLKDRYKEWVIESVDPEFRKEKQQYWQKKIILFHNFLQELELKHLIFNCYSFFQYIDSKHNWNNCYIDPYTESSTYYFWLKNQGYQPANARYYHYGPDAHQAWSNFLLPKIHSILTNN